MKRVLRLDMDANAVPKRVLSSFFFFGYLFCFVNNYREKFRSNNRDCAIFSIMDENLLPMS